MGLPGSGKSGLAIKLHSFLPDSVRLNADVVRRETDDWDFSLDGRIRQAVRMRNKAEYYKKCQYVIADFVAPLNIHRKIFDPDILIWMNTIQFSEYEDTNKIFEPPEKYDFMIERHEEINKLFSDLQELMKI